MLEGLREAQGRSTSWSFTRTKSRVREQQCDRRLPARRAMSWSFRTRIWSMTPGARRADRADYAMDARTPFSGVALRDTRIACCTTGTASATISLTTLSNMATNLNLSDMETCYKMVRLDLMKSLPLSADRFGIEPELTARLAQAGARIYEVPITLQRSYVRRGEEDRLEGWSRRPCGTLRGRIFCRGRLLGILLRETVSNPVAQAAVSVAERRDGGFATSRRFGGPGGGCRSS